MSPNTAASSAAEPQAGVGDGLEGGGLDVGGDELDIAEAVDEADPLREAAREGGEAGRHALLELDTLRLDAVGAAVAGAGAGQPDDRSTSSTSVTSGSTPCRPGSLTARTSSTPSLRAKP